LTAEAAGSHIAVEDRVPLIPGQAYRLVTIGRHTYWCSTLAVCIPSLGKVRIMMNFAHESLTERSVVLVTNRVNWNAARIITRPVSLEALTRWLRIGCRSCRVLLESATLSL